MWFFIGAIIVFIFIKFISSVNSDTRDTAANPIELRFRHIFDRINEAAFNGRAGINKLDRNRVVLFLNGANQMVIFTYMFKNLEVEWKYKYMQKETVFKETYNNVDNISIYDQEKIANRIVTKMREQVNNHVNQTEANVSHAERSAVLGFENSNPLDMTFREKAATFSLLLTMAGADGDIDPSEMTVLNSARQLFDIDDIMIARMQAMFVEEDYDTNDAFREFSQMNKTKRDVVLVTLNDIASADSFIHHKEVNFMNAVASKCGYTPDEASAVIDKHHNLMRVFNQ